MQQIKSTERKTKSKEPGISCSVPYVLCFLVFAFCTLLFASIFIRLGFAAERHINERIALLPFENFSEDKNALTFIMPVLKNRLEAKGVEVLNEESLKVFLLKERIRSTGYISKDMARKLGEELNVKAILVGSVNSFFTGENPSAGFSARLINSADGSLLWANHASATGNDFITILGLGRVTTIDMLTYKVLDKLLESFSITTPNKVAESTYRIAVMPFQNKSKIKNAGMIAAYMFIVELFKNNNFEPIEYGEVRSLIVDFRIMEKGELDFKKTEAISKSSGVDGIIVGTVETYSEGEGTVPPGASIDARLIDARRNKILWCDSYQSKGDDDIVILDWGRISSAENVAYKVVSKLVKEMSKAKWQ